MTKIESRPLDQSKMASIAKVELVKATLADLYPTSEVFAADGMGWTYAWNWAIAGTADGKEWMLCRWLGPDDSANFALLETGKGIWGEPVPRFAPAPGMDNLYWGELRWNDRGDHIECVSHNPLYPTLRSELRTDTYRHIEGDVLDITIHAWDDRVQISVPGPPCNVGYTTECGLVTGTIDGSEIVWGYGGHERSYGPPGISWYRSKISTHLEELWMIWGSAVPGEPRESGLVCAGPGDFAIAYHSREGEEPFIDNKFDLIDIDWQEKDGRVLPASVHCAFGGREFYTEHNGSNVGAASALAGVDWVTGTTTQTNRADATTCRAMTEFFRTLHTVE